MNYEFVGHIPRIRIVLPLFIATFPGIPTNYPAIVLNEYDKGKVLYVVAYLESVRQEPHSKIFTNLLKLLSTKPFFFEADDPQSVEVTIFYQEEKKRYLINFLNFQAGLPNISVEGIKLRLRLSGEKPKKLIKIPEEKELPYEIKENYRIWSSLYA